MKLRTIGRIIGGLVAFIIIALLAAPLFISSETLKTQLVAQVKKATGRTLEIRGDTSVTLFPTIAVKVEDVSLSNPGGFTTPYLISLKKLATGAQLRPLLRGELVIDGITLDGAVINLEELSGGAKNWEFTAEKVKDTAEKTAKAPESQEYSSSPLKRFALGDITITNSTVNILKPKANVVAVKNINATLRGADANSPLSLEGSADYNNEQVSLALDIAKTRQFIAGEDSPVVASVKLPGASADFTGDARMGEAPTAKGKFNATVSSLAKVMEWATAQPAPGKLPEQFSLRGDVAYADKALDIRQAQMRVDKTNLTGALRVSMAQAVPAITGAVAAQQVDLDSFMPAAEKPAGGGIGMGKDAQTPAAGWDTTPIDLSGLKAVNAELALSLEGLKAGKFTLGRTHADIAVKDGALALAIKEMALYGGTGSGTLRASAAGIGTAFRIADVDIDALMTALAGQSRLTGRADLTLDARASGTNQRAWAGSMNGKGALKVRDGALKGINIGQFLRNAKQGTLFKSEVESTDFTELTASFTIASGVLSNNDLAMKSPALRLSGEGKANLGERTVNYRLTPRIAATSKGQGGKDAVGGLDIPLIITGNWGNPSVMPDFAGMAKEGLRDPEALKQNLQGVKDIIGDYNSKDDLKRALLGGEKPAAPATATPGEAAEATNPSREDKLKEGIGALLKGL